MDWTPAEEALIEELEKATGNFWAGEAEVVRTYFDKTRTREQDLVWLRHQTWKEIKQIPIIAQSIIEATKKVGHEVSYEEYIEITQKCHDEANHYVWMAQCLQELVGKPIGLEESMGPLPEQVKLGSIRREYTKKSPHPAVEAASSAWPEGGGSSITFKELSKITGGRLESKIAEAAKKIYEDEVGHGVQGAQAIIRAMKRFGLDKETRTLVLDAARTVCRQRLRMRNEMFGFPLTQQRLAEIEEGKNVTLVRLRDL